MTDIKKVKFARKTKNTAGFFKLLFALSLLVYTAVIMIHFGDSEMISEEFLYSLIGGIALHLIFAIALFTATTPKWLWFPVGVLAVSSVSDLYEVLKSYDFEISFLTVTDLFMLCIAVGYVILFLMLFAKGLAKKLWLVPAVLLSAQSVNLAWNFIKNIRMVIDMLDTDYFPLALLNLTTFASDILTVVSVFFICLYVGRYSKHYLLIKNLRTPSPVHTSAPSESTSTPDTSFEKKASSDSAPASESSKGSVGSSAASKIDSTKECESDGFDDALAAEIESGLGGSTSDDTSSDEGDLASEIDKLMGN